LRCRNVRAFSGTVEGGLYQSFLTSAMRIKMACEVRGLPALNAARGLTRLVAHCRSQLPSIWRMAAGKVGG
jgi:hypothetical protein